MSFQSIGLSSQLLEIVTKLGYTAPTPVQTLAIPKALRRCDLITIAQTGTGKTAAYALPLVQNLNSTPAKTPNQARALILTPTRELALQVYQDLGAFGLGSGLRGVLLHGGVGYGAQIAALSAGVDVIVATPGRLRDHLEQKNLGLSVVEILVLDEADRMLDMGFGDDVGMIISKTPRSRQTMLFSATFSTEIRRLAQQHLNSPLSIEVTPEKVTAQSVVHTLHPVTAERKLDLLFEVVHKHLDKQIMIFTRTKDRVDEVTKDLLHRGLVCMAIHGDKTQAHRTKALARFKEGAIQVLVATDVAARGLDTAELKLVINYELPNLAEDYVHRIGRTGRAGKAGQAVSLVTPNEQRFLAAIEDLIKFKIPVVPFAGFAAPPFSQRPPSSQPGSRKKQSAHKQRPSAKAPWGQVHSKSRGRPVRATGKNSAERR